MMGITPLVNTEKSNDTDISDDFQELQPPLMDIRGGFCMENFHRPCFIYGHE